MLSVGASARDAGRAEARAGAGGDATLPVLWTSVRAIASPFRLARPGRCNGFFYNAIAAVSGKFRAPRRPATPRLQRPPSGGIGGEGAPEGRRDGPGDGTRDCGCAEAGTERHAPSASAQRLTPASIPQQTGNHAKLSEGYGSGGRDRTYDQLINSQLLYR